MRRTCKFECFSFDVACVQCGHPHSHQQFPFACVALRRVPHPVWIGPQSVPMFFLGFFCHLS